MRIVRDTMTRAQLAVEAGHGFGDMIKAVVDVRRGVMAIGAELHADEESALIDDGSQQGDLWGINLYPNETGEEWLEFDSMINVRPARGNHSRGVDDAETREAIGRVVRQLVSDP